MEKNNNGTPNSIIEKQVSCRLLFRKYIHDILLFLQIQIQIQIHKQIQIQIQIQIKNNKIIK